MHPPDASTFGGHIGHPPRHRHGRFRIPAEIKFQGRPPSWHVILGRIPMPRYSAESTDKFLTESTGGSMVKIVRTNLFGVLTTEATHNAPALFNHTRRDWAGDRAAGGTTLTILLLQGKRLLGIDRQNTCNHADVRRSRACVTHDGCRIPWRPA